MPYSLDLANVLVGQLTRFAKFNRHDLAGRLANLDFWVAEVSHCVEVIDNYRARFERMKAAQSRYVAQHETIRFDLQNPATMQGPPVAAKPIDEIELKNAKRAVCDAAYDFLLRCYEEGLMDEAAVRQTCGRLRIGVDVSDFKPRV